MQLRSGLTSARFIAKQTTNYALAFCIFPAPPSATSTTNYSARGQYCIWLVIVRSTITTLPDSTKIVDETRKFFRTKSDIRNHIRDAYQTEIARDSTAIAVASQSLARRKQERRDLLQSLRAGGGSAPRSSVAPPAVPAQPPNTSKKKKKQ